MLEVQKQQQTSTKLTIIKFMFRTSMRVLMIKESMIISTLKKRMPMPSITTIETIIIIIMVEASHT